MVVQVENIRKHQTPGKEICQAGLKMISTSEKCSLNSILSPGSHLSETKSLKNASSLRKSVPVVKAIPGILKKVTEDIISKHVIVKQKLFETREKVFGKVAQKLRKVANEMDALCTYEKDVGTVVLVPAKVKNMNNEHLKMKTYTIAEGDENSGFFDRDQTYERLDYKWAMEIKLVPYHGITKAETLIVISRNQMYERDERSSDFDTDQIDFTDRDELDPLTRQMYDKPMETLDTEFETWAMEKQENDLLRDQNYEEGTLQNCDEKFEWTMEESVIAERERLYELQSNQIEVEDTLPKKLDNCDEKIEWTMEESEIAERERLYELQSNQIEDEDALPKKLDNCDEKIEWTMEESEIAERERLYELQSYQIEDEDALPKKLDNCDEKIEWTMEESEIAERERLYELKSNRIEDEDALPKKLDNCDEKIEWTMEESEIAERERLYELKSNRIGDEDALPKKLDNCDEKIEWTMEESEIAERERLYEIMKSQFEELDAIQDGSEGPFGRERGEHEVMISNTRDDMKEMNIALTVNPHEDGKSMVDQFHTKKDKKDNTYECDEKAEYEESGKDTKRAGCDCAALMAAVEDVDKTSPGAGAGSDEAEDIGREIVKGTSRHEYAKMDDVVEKWQEQAKECSRELVGEQVSQRKPQHDKCQRGYDYDALETEGRTYGRDEGETEKGGCDKGIDKAGDEYKESALGKDNPQKEEHGPTKTTARAVKRSQPRCWDDTRNMARSRNDDYQNQQIQNDGIISSMPLEKELPDTVTHGRSSEIPNLHYKNVALGSSEKKTNLNATKQAKRASKKRSRRMRPRSPPREGCFCSIMREADNQMEPTLLKTMAPDEMDRWFRLLETLFSRLLQCQLEARQSCKSTSVRKRRQTGDDVQRCELSAGILLDHAGDSQETITTKDEILHKIGNNPNNPKALFHLAASLCKGTLKTFQLEQLTTGKRPEHAAESVVREFNHQGLTMGHLVKYFNDDCTCRDDILRLIDKIHPNCVYCCPNRSCK